jgi:hypothetical protein
VGGWGSWTGLEYRILGRRESSISSHASVELSFLRFVFPSQCGKAEMCVGREVVKYNGRSIFKVSFALGSLVCENGFFYSVISKGEESQRNEKSRACLALLLWLARVKETQTFRIYESARFEL